MHLCVIEQFFAGVLLLKQPFSDLRIIYIGRWRRRALYCFDHVFDNFGGESILTFLLNLIHELPSCFLPFVLHKGQSFKFQGRNGRMGLWVASQLKLLNKDARNLRKKGKGEDLFFSRQDNISLVVLSKFRFRISDGSINPSRTLVIFGG